jgi:hypothetical protein
MYITYFDMWRDAIIRSFTSESIKNMFILSTLFYVNYNCISDGSSAHIISYIQKPLVRVKFITVITQF